MFKGEHIRAKRESLGLSAGELAAILDVSKANLYKWEKGHRPSNPKDYLKVEKWLNGKVESVPNATTATETPQNGQQSGAVLSDTRTEIAKLVARIKAETGLKDDDIAKRVGRSRQWLSDLCNHKPYSESNYQKILSPFKDVLNAKPTPQPNTNPASDKYLTELMDYLRRDKEWFQKQFETNLNGLLMGHKAIAARVATILDKDNERDAGGNKKKEQHLREQTDRRIDEWLQAFGQMDNTLNR